MLPQSQCAGGDGVSVRRGEAAELDVRNPSGREMGKGGREGEGKEGRRRRKEKRQRARGEREPGRKGGGKRKKEWKGRKGRAARGPQLKVLMSVTNT